MARSRKQSVTLDIIKQRSREERNIKNRELDFQVKKLQLGVNSLILQQKHLDFEKNMFEFEEKERTTRLKMEMQERKAKLEADQEQRNLFLSLLQTIA